MSGRQRVSLKDRNRRAITTPEPDPAQVDQQEAPSAAGRRPEPALHVSAPQKAPSEARRPRSAGETNTIRLGIYFHPDEFDDAKAAYLVDWKHGGQADTFARWIAAAIDAHAGRSAEERAQLERPPRDGQGRGGTRSFTIPTDSAERMRQAINADQDAGRWASDSAWCGDAIAAAVRLAESKVGGTLPRPPARLPNRLTR